MAPGPIPERGAEVCGQLPCPDSGAAGSYQVFGLLYSYCVLVSSSLASGSRATAEIPRDCALEASCRGLLTRTKGPKKFYHGTFVQLENLFSSNTMHSRLLPGLLAPGTTPTLQLPALDMT